MLQPPLSETYNPTNPNYQGNYHKQTIDVLLVLFYFNSKSAHYLLEILKKCRGFGCTGLLRSNEVIH